MIEAMKQALEALYPISHNSTDDYRGQADKAITSLRQAIREHAMYEVQRLGQEIEQEPVATLEDLEQEIYENTRQFVSRDVMEWMLKRYYTTPPQRTWVGLTESDRRLINFEWQDGNGTATEIIDLVEAKLKEKNGYAEENT